MHIIFKTFVYTAIYALAVTLLVLSAMYYTPQFIEAWEYWVK